MENKWIRSKANDTPGYSIYLKTTKIGKVTVYLWMAVDVLHNAHVSLSSGSKRKHKFTFEDKGEKNSGVGVELLTWVRDNILNFPKEYSRINSNVYQLRSITVGAADSRRRRIYKRGLEPYGFKEIRTIHYGLVLYKKFTK